REALRATKKKEKDCSGVPNPAVSEAGGGNHPIANPPRSAPTVQTPHQTMIAALDETPYIAGNGHVVPRCAAATAKKTRLRASSRRDPRGGAERNPFHSRASPTSCRSEFRSPSGRQ